MKKSKVLYRKPKIAVKKMKFLVLYQPDFGGIEGNLLAALCGTGCGSQACPAECSNTCFCAGGNCGC